MNVILVEDNPGDVELIREALQTQPTTSLVVLSDGEQALAHLRSVTEETPHQKPDLVLLDLKIPRVSGLELLAELKRHPYLRTIPVIVLTSSQAPQDMARAYELQATACFSKPVDGFERLLDTIFAFARMASRPPANDKHTDVITWQNLPTKAAVQELESREILRMRHLAAIVESAADAIVGMDLDGTILSWNRQAEQLYGYPANEAIGRPISLVVSKQRENEIQRISDAIRQGASMQRLRTTRVDQNGREVDVELTISPIKDGSGAIVGKSAIARDITEQKQTEERFRLAVEASPSAMVMVNHQGKIVLVNAETEHLFGYSRKQLIGQSIEILVPERFRSHHPELRQGFGASPEFRAMGKGRELFGLRSDHTELPIEIGLNPIHTSEGLLVLCSIVDITERRMGEEKFRIALEAAPSGIVMIDRHGQIVLVNAETERLFGYQRDELIGQSIDLLVPRRFRGQHARHRASFGGNPETRSMGSGRDLYGMRKDGSEFPVEVGLNPIRTKDGFFVLSTIVDIASRKQIEQELAQQREELLRSNAELEQFAYVASHDLQEPLRMVSIYTQRLVEHLGDKLDEKAQRFVNYAQEGAIRMRHLIDDLLSFSRVRSYGQELRPMEAQRCLDHALETLHLAIKEAGAQIKSEVNAQVMADKSQLAAVFQNLISNALKFRSDAPPQIHITSRPDGNMWRFAVQDNGIGIDPRHSEQIFQVFERLHTREQYPGTGIGLALCKRVLERHGGTIWVESDGQAGSTFLFTLPAAPPEQP